MAKAVINLQKESGGIVKISPVDGIGVTEVTVPESGELVTKEYVDDTVNTSVGQLSTDFYQGAYGFSWDYATDTYIRTGAKGYTAIQSKMRRCVLNADGSVNYYLHSDNSNFKKDTFKYIKDTFIYILIVSFKKILSNTLKSIFF